MVEIIFAGLMATAVENVMLTHDVKLCLGQSSS